MTVSALVCKNVTKQFYVYSHRTVSIREWFIRTVKRQPMHIGNPKFSLQDFNLLIRKGESLALIGSNGSGKSTVLRLMAGIYDPSAGEIERNGSYTAVMELGAGFNPELTGAENVALYGAVMGLTRRKIAQHFPEIVSFAELENFIEIPVKYYSSGMIARLAFAVAFFADPEILLLDEVLAVGDHKFRERCFDRLRRFQAGGGTMIVVSHDLELIKTMCSRAVWLEEGRIRMNGEVHEVVNAYIMTTQKEQSVHGNN